MKACSKCKLVKPLEAFSRSNDTKIGRKSQCKECVSADNKEYASRPEVIARMKEKSREHYVRNKADILKRTKQYFYKKQYGMTREQVTELIEQQNNRCAICQKHPSERLAGGARLRVDHCHTTGKIRGLLCHSCNAALGLFKDDPSLLLKAALYLETASKPETLRLVK